MKFWYRDSGCLLVVEKPQTIIDESCKYKIGKEYSEFQLLKEP
eukprot:UN07575